jgi:copper resistance protein B
MSARRPPATTIAIVAPLILLLAAAPDAIHAQSHDSHDPGQETSKPASPPQADHSAHQKPPDPKPYPPGIPPITDDDRAAAFPKLNGQHAVHDDATQYFVLFDQLEWQVGDGANAGSWENTGWFGGDVNRFWFRTEGDVEDGGGATAQAHALYGRAIHPWWNVVVGVRQDFRPDPSRTWAAVGLQGLAPHWFQVEATAYIGASGRTHFRVETEYELLLTNRLILQPLVEVEIFGKSDPERRIGAGLSSADAGLRLRYEIRREFAPYVGVTWNQTFFGTADLARAAGEPTSGTRLALGVRVWF